MEISRQAERILKSSEADVRSYMSGVFPRLAMSYGIPIVIVFILSLILRNRLPLLLSQYIAPTIGLLINLVALFISWKLIDSRTKATGLFVLYSNFSRRRRDLQAILKSGIVDAELIHNMTEVVASSAEIFINAAEESGIKPTTQVDK